LADWLAPQALTWRRKVLARTESEILPFLSNPEVLRQVFISVALGAIRAATLPMGAVSARLRQQRHCPTGDRFELV
jgi:hypothetical protein